MLRHWIDIDNLNGRFLSMNPRAISLLEQHPEKIDWYWISANPKAMPLLEKNLDKVDWSMLSSNPSAVPLLKKTWTRWIGFGCPIIIVPRPCFY